MVRVGLKCHLPLQEICSDSQPQSRLNSQPELGAEGTNAIFPKDRDDPGVSEGEFCCFEKSEVLWERGMFLVAQ